MNSPAVNNLRVPAIIATIIAAFLTGWLVSGKFAKPAQPRYASILPSSKPLPEFSLLDQDGERFGAGDFAGSWSLLFFGFTHCPDICPATLQVMSLARQQMAEEQLELPRLVLVSVDPDRDSPAVMNKYTGHFGDGVMGLTGDDEELHKLTSALGIFYEKEEPASDSGAYNVAHSAHVVVLDDAGDYHAVFGAPHSVDRFTADLPILMSAK